jgi:hypothetical protein
MAGEQERVDGYLATIARLEPDIHMIDAAAFYASAAISLKRIADVLEMTERRKAKAIQDYQVYLDIMQEENRRRAAQPFWKFILGFKP